MTLFARLTTWLGRRPQAPPLALQLRMVRLRAEVKRGGRGSDLAAAELRGITETIMALARQRSSNHTSNRSRIVTTDELRGAV